jgi:hypothetical protein
VECGNLRLRISEDTIYHKIPNLKHQITNKFQISIFNDQNIHLSYSALRCKLRWAGDDAIGQHWRQIICWPATSLAMVSPSVVSSGANDSGLKRSAVSNFEFGLLGFICNLFFGIWNFLNLIVDD